ncbi:hypothetical protein [Yersinia rohdei]|uniref:DUF968 domain-containing protein n=1 Tax=Yersinia rohdei TaxID=29485 RepID=UPI0025AB5183|nr:hypothetical protein [Yersinia rohdei]MDN0096831.1 hypothetical protein [Yersinia rohdei]
MCWYITWASSPTLIIEIKLELVKRGLALKIDDAPPASFMRIPKQYRGKAPSGLSGLNHNSIVGMAVLPTTPATISSWFNRMF